MEDKFVDVYEIYEYCEATDSDAIMLDFDKQKYLRDVCKIVNGEIIYLKEGYVLKKILNNN